MSFITLWLYFQRVLWAMMLGEVRMRSWVGYVRSEELGWALFTDGAADSLWEGLLGISGGGCPHQSSLGSSLLPRVSTPRSAETCSNGGVSTTDTIKNSHSEDKQGACSGQQPGVLHSRGYQSGSSPPPPPTRNEPSV